MLCKNCEAIRFPPAHPADCAKPTCNNASEPERIRDPSALARSTPTNTVTTPDKLTTATKLSTVPENTATETRIVINELLSYFQFYRDRGNTDGLHRVASTFYTGPEISAAKKCLINIFQTNLTGCSFITERRNSSARQAYDAELEDILGTMDWLDNRKLFSSVSFAAVNHDRIPHYGPEEINICAVVDRQTRADANIEQLSEYVNELRNHPTSNIHADPTINDLSTGVTELNDKMATLMGDMATLLQRESRTAGSKVPPTRIDTRETEDAEPDRSRNIVVVGIAEDPNANIWRSKLSNLLKTVAGRDVMISDAFRLGRYRTDCTRTRAILVKLCSVWDQRLVLSNTRVLASLDEFKGTVYIHADEPAAVRQKNIELRRMKTMKLLFERARKEGKAAVISEDGSSLTINEAVVYTLKEGHMILSGRPDRSDGEANI